MCTKFEVKKVVHVEGGKLMVEGWVVAQYHHCIREQRQIRIEAHTLKRQKIKERTHS